MSLRRGKRKGSEDEMLDMDSSSIGEGGSSRGTSRAGGGGRGGQGEIVLKKGPWTTAEDAILVEYVKKHGEGNWNTVQKYSGLSRCGKSCRLRWANHLRPNLKKGGFTPEEEKLIIELHAKIGNKWAQMAAHMPGRTDNEIKNYWNTRIKRLQRAGIPLYPPELCVQQQFQESQPYQNGNGFHGGDKGHNDPLQANNYDISDVMYGNLSNTQGFLSYIPPCPDFSADSSLMKGRGLPLLYSFTTQTGSCQKRLRQSEHPLSGYDGGTRNECPQFVRDQDKTSRRKSSETLNVCFPYDPDAISTKLLPFPANQGRQSLLNGNFSAFKPIIGAENSELPSFQYPETSLGSWVTNPSLPALYSADTFIQSPPVEPNYSYCPSPVNSGSLEALVYQAKPQTGSKYPPSEKSSNSSTPADVTDCFPLTMYSPEYEGYGNPHSPYGNSSGSMFSNCTPISATRSSSEEKPFAENFSGSNIKSEPNDPTWNLDEERDESSTHLNFLRPDAILDSCWFGQPVSYSKFQSIPTDAMASFHGDDLCSDITPIGSETALGNTLDMDSCSWKNMPPVCQMSELP